MRPNVLLLVVAVVLVSLTIGHTQQPNTRLPVNEDVLRKQSALMARANPPETAQSRFTIKRADGEMVVSIFRPGINFTLDNDVLVVENDAGEPSARVGTAEGGVLLVEQGDTLIETHGFVRLKQNGQSVLHISITGDAVPLASLEQPVDTAITTQPDKLFTEPEQGDPFSRPVGSPVESDTTIPPRVRITN